MALTILPGPPVTDVSAGVTKRYYLICINGRLRRVVQ